MCADAVRGDEQRDVVIVGAGAAGVSCALECVDIQLDTAVFEADERPGGQLAEIPHSVRNVATGPLPRRRRAARRLGRLGGDPGRSPPPGRIPSPPPTSVNDGSRSTGVRIRAEALVIATGTRHQQLPAAADGAFGGDVTYLLEARPDQFAGRDVVVIGGGDSGTLDALELARAGSKVTLGPSLGCTHGTPRHRRAGSPGAAHRGRSPDGSWDPWRVATASRP